jgi:predicted amidohydrolase
MTAVASGKQFTMACIQFEPRIGERSSNLDGMVAKIRIAHGNGARLMVLPELADSGCVFKNAVELAELAYPIPTGESSQRLISLAAELNIYIVSGLAEVDNGQYFNSTMLCGPEGHIGKYRKLHLWNNENLIFEKGNLGLPVFDTPFGRIGMAICYDGWFPESFRLLADAGAEIVCVPTNWIPMPGQEPKAEAMSNTLHKAAAHSNGLYIACACRVGTERGQPFVGQSLIIDPHGFLLAGPAAWDAEDILYAKIDSSKVETIRQFNEHNNILGDRRKDLYG